MLRAYMAQVRERAGEAWGKIRGVRYLVQDKAAGTMSGDGFVEGLRWLGREGLVFDLGVDARSGGLGQLREAVEMMGRVYEEVEGTIVISMCFFFFFFLSLERLAVFKETVDIVGFDADGSDRSSLQA